MRDMGADSDTYSGPWLSCKRRTERVALERVVRLAIFRDSVIVVE